MLNDFYYSNLSSQEQFAYNTIRAALLNSDSECTLRDLDLTSVKKAWKAVVLENPDVISYPGLFCVPSQRGNITTFHLEYSQVDQSKYEQKLNILLQKINEKLTVSASDYLVCKTIFDTLATSITYQDKVLNEFLRLSRENSFQMISFMERNSNAFTPYGIVVNSKGVCQGLSKLYKILCNRFGVECACVEAKTKNCGENDEANHMLNAVEINGARAFVDVTNGLIHKDVPVVRYDFFLCSSRIIKKEFIILNEFGCNDENINYFAKNGLRFKTVDDLRRYLSAYTSSSMNSEIRIHYDGKQINDDELQELCLYIIDSHCESGKQVKVIVKNGFCTGKIIDEVED